VPTVLDWVGGTAPPGLRGRSLRAAIERGAAIPGDAGFYAEALYGRYHYGWSDLYALTDARYRYIKAPRPELYDLDRDPAEKQNVAADRAQTATAMRSALGQLMSGAAIDKPGSVSKEDLAKLQALGYVGSQAELTAAPAESLPDPKDKIGVLEKYRKAVELSLRRDYSGAIAVLKTILLDDPGMKDIWLQLGIAQVRSGQPADALESFKRLVSIDPRDGQSLISVAQVLSQLGRADEAAAHAQAALAVLPAGDAESRTTAYQVLVKVALSKNDPSAARQAAAQARRADPSFPLPTYVDGLILYNQGRYAEALPLFQETIRGLSGHTITIPDLYYYTGDTLARLGEARPAIEAFRTETRLSPENIRAHAGLAMLCRADGQTAEAEAAIDRLLHAVPTADGYAMAIRLWSIFGERERASTLQQAAAGRFGPAAMADAERRLLPSKRPGQKPPA